MGGEDIKHVDHESRILTLEGGLKHLEEGQQGLRRDVRDLTETIQTSIREKGKVSWGLVTTIIFGFITNFIAFSGLIITVTTVASAVVIMYVNGKISPLVVREDMMIERMEDTKNRVTKMEDKFYTERKAP